MKHTNEKIKENQTELPPDYPWVVTVGSDVKMIPLDAIVSTTTTQIRESYNEETIKEFERMYRSEDEPGAAQLPSIVVVLCPGSKDKYWILDGHHRYTAAVRAHMTAIPAKIVTPDKKRYLEVKDISDLHFLQARENGQTIANRTVETKRRQVRAALTKRPNWTNKQIAVYCNVSFEFVDKVRTEMEKEGTIAATKKPSEKAEEAVANPANKKKSNRELAKELNVDEKTIRQVRKNSTSKNSAPALTPELEEYLSKQNWTEQQKKDFAEGVRAYHEYENENSMPKTSNWADGKLDGYMYEEERIRQSEKDATPAPADKDADALDKVSQKAREFMDEHAPAENVTPAEPAKVQYETPEVLDAPPASADDKEEPADMTSNVPKSGSIPLRNPDNILMVVEDVINWLGSGRIEYFATIFNDKISNPQ